MYEVIVAACEISLKHKGWTGVTYLYRVNKMQTGDKVSPCFGFFFLSESC